MTLTRCFVHEQGWWRRVWSATFRSSTTASDRRHHTIRRQTPRANRGARMRLCFGDFSTPRLHVRITARGNERRGNRKKSVLRAQRLSPRRSRRALAPHHRLSSLTSSSSSSDDVNASFRSPHLNARSCRHDSSGLLAISFSGADVNLTKF